MGNRWLGWGVVGCLSLLMACGGADPTRAGTGNGLDGDGDSSGNGDSSGDRDSSDDDDEEDLDTGCGEIEKTAEVQRGPVDIILGMDSSFSMALSICNVSMNLTALADGLGEETHVAAVYEMGILGGAALTACGSADPLADTALAKDKERYLHVSNALDSTDGLSVLVSSFDQYKGFLRDDAPTHVIMLSDDNAEIPYLMADTFKQAMEQKLGGEFIYHAIVVPDASCPSIGGVGSEHIKLAKDTGGEVLSICGNFSELFKDLQSAVAATAPIPCEFEIPEPPEDEIVNVESGVRVLFKEPGAKKRTEFPRATDKGKCGDNLGWYPNEAGTHIEFCPEACDAVKKGGSVSIGFGCAAIIL
jgi:hypothetical protein